MNTNVCKCCTCFHFLLLNSVNHYGTVNKSFVLPKPPLASWQKDLFWSTLKEGLMLSFGSWFLCSPHFKPPPWQGYYLFSYILETRIVKQISVRCWSCPKYCKPPHLSPSPRLAPSLLACEPLVFLRFRFNFPSCTHSSGCFNSKTFLSCVKYLKPICQHPAQAVANNYFHIQFDFP